MLINKRDYSSRFVLEWSKWVPLKCNIFMWRAEVDRIPSLVVLDRRTIQVENQICSQCDSRVEFTNIFWFHVNWRRWFGMELVGGATSPQFLHSRLETCWSSMPTLILTLQLKKLSTVLLWLRVSVFGKLGTRKGLRIKQFPAKIFFKVLRSSVSILWVAFDFL